MAKLTETQERTLKTIKEDIAFAKKFESFREYWIGQRLRGQEKCHDYLELYKYYSKRFEANAEELTRDYIKYWLDYKNNIALTTCSSATIRALEREGYIEILHDSANERYGIDKVKLLKE